jgi:23S rRNA (cytidine1920-2'-O)/16S rRNA (cytidine1409-2'-O)-methyltransferase
MTGERRRREDSLAGQKVRLDVLLVKRGLFQSREQAKAATLSGQVRVDGQKICKPAVQVPADAELSVAERPPYVSRGGLKLEKAIRVFRLNLEGKVVLDVGASTGGFTDCALSHGARLVYAVDVGYGQLAWKLRTCPQVVVLERTNIRHLSKEMLPLPPDFAVVDVSFISLKLVLPRVGELTTEDSGGVVLVKPQFEAGREKVGKRGVVRDPLVHREVLAEICSLVTSLRWKVRGLDYSPLRGPEGNIEFLLYYEKKGGNGLLPEEIKAKISSVVEEAHHFLN